MSSFRHRQEGVRTHRRRAFRVAHWTMAPRISIPTAPSTPSPPYILDIFTFILYVSPLYRPPLHRSIVGTRSGKAPHAGVRHVEINMYIYIYILYTYICIYIYVYIYFFFFYIFVIIYFHKII